MRRKIFSVLTAIMVAVVICQLSGCVPLIKGIGSPRKDAIIQNQDIILSSEWHTIKPGTRLYVLLKSGARLRGKCKELIRVTPEEYAASYAECREQLKEEIVLPELGETITVISKSGKHHELEFFGFDHGIILFRVERIGKTRTAKENIGLIKNIVDSRGNIIEGETVSKLISEGKISLLSSGIILKSNVRRIQIAWEDISQIQKKKGKSFDIVPLVLVGVLAAVVGSIAIIDSIERDLEESCTFGAATSNSPMYAYLNTIRDFRDKYLLPHEFGRELVRLYYKYSPYVANIVAKHKVLKVAVRTNLIPLIAFCYSMVHFGPIITGVLLIFIFMLPFFIAVFHRRKLRQVR